MAKNERFLTVDIGATSIKLCEFEADSTGRMVLSVFAYREYEEELSDDTRMGVVEGVLRQMLMENNVRARKTLISLSGQSGLIRFGRVTSPNDDKRQIRALAKFEATNNLPYELDKVGLDYQLITGSQEDQDNHTIGVMSVVVRNDLLEQYTQAVRNVGLDPVLIDQAPVACYNAARANGLGSDECVLIVSMGGRSTNLMFIEGERFFARIIPIAGYSITQQIAKEFGIGMPEAEELKRHHGFVSLGGAYADPVSETAANVSKIIRNVMTRLHGEIARSINIYRAQQRGSSPTKIYLTGGSSILSYCDVFFAEKFNIPCEFFNPFTVVNLSPQVDRERLSHVAHTFGETIGLGFRYTTHCPIEINLLPKMIQRQRALASKKPFFVAAMVCILVMVGVILQGASITAAKAKQRAAHYAKERAAFERPYKSITGAISEAEAAVSNINNLKTFMSQRSMWPMIMEEILRAKPNNVWIDTITPVSGEMKAFEPASVAKSDSSNNANDNPFGGGDGLFDSPSDGGGDSLFGGGDTQSSGPSKVVVGGFTIKAHTVAFNPALLKPDTATGTEPTYPFEVPEDSAKQAATSGEGDEAANTPAVNNDLSGEGIFVHNLRQSKLFSADPKMTVVTSRTLSPAFQNISDFTLQLKLNLKVEATPWPFNKQVNMGESRRR